MCGVWGEEKAQMPVREKAIKKEILSRSYIRGKLKMAQWLWQDRGRCWPPREQFRERVGDKSLIGGVRRADGR